MFRLAIFIDGAYLERIAMRTDFRVDYEKLSPEILARVAARTPAAAMDLLRTYYYNCPIYQSNPPTESEKDRYQNQRRFFDALEHLPSFAVRLGVMKYRGNDEYGKPIYLQKQVDLMLGLDFALLSAKRSITHAALISGDSDMLPAIEIAQGAGIAVWLFSGEEQSHAGELWRVADERVPIDPAFLSAIRLERETPRASWDG